MTRFRCFSAAMAVIGAMVMPLAAQTAQNAPPAARPSEDLPVLGLAGVTFRSSDLAKSRKYYTGVLGFAEAFTLKDASGVSSAFFKINDDQYVEVVENLKPGELQRIARVMVQVSDIERLHRIYAERGLAPSPIKKGPDGNPVFRIVGPSEAPIDFIQYVPGSQQTRARGKFLSPDRLSTHLWHVGVMTKDRAAVAPFYQEKLGFGRTLPGGRGESIDTPNSDGNTETKPRLDANDPAVHDRYISEQWGAVNHMGLEIADMRVARDLAQKRGGYTDLQVRAAVGGSRHWLVHLFDPAGSRSELMETALQDPAVLPSGTLMAPGPPAPPILPASRGRSGQ